MTVGSNWERHESKFDVLNSDIVTIYLDLNQRNVMVCIMPTDGADFGRTKPCYGKAYTMAREGAEDADVAECAIRSVEIDNYKRSAPQCSYCPSCLVRRLSFHAAGLSDEPRNYSTDIFKPRRPLGEAEWLPLSKLTVQADSLAACLRVKQPWPGLCAKWPDLLRTEMELNSPGFREPVINLLRRHVDEWRSFSSAIHSELLSFAA